MADLKADEIVGVFVTDPNGAKCDRPNPRCEQCGSEAYAIAVINTLLNSGKVERSERKSLCCGCLKQLERACKLVSAGFIEE